MYLVISLVHEGGTVVLAEGAICARRTEYHWR